VGRGLRYGDLPLHHRCLEVVPMRSACQLAAAGILTALLAGCGGSSSMISGLTPKDIVKVSTKHVQQQSLRADLSGRFVLDASHLTNVTPAQLRQFGALGNGYTLSGHQDQESLRRLQLTLTLLPDYNNSVVVVYDGQTFYSKDGTRFAAAGQLSSLTAGIGITPGDLSNYLGFLGDLKDLGTATQDGMTVEHLQSNIDQNILDQVLGASVGPSPNANGFADLFKQFIEVQGGTIDMYVVPATAELDRIDMKLRFAFNFSKISGLFGATATPVPRKGGPTIPGGTLDFDVAVSSHMYDYGAKITVKKPTVDPTAPKPPTGGLFGGLGS
jgi:hypothetical protein